MITHVLKDGRTAESIQGHRVSPVECPELYEILGRIYRKGADGREKNPQKPERVA